MKRILILGAGKSSVYLISYLLGIAKERDYFITVCDRDEKMAQDAVNHHSQGQAIGMDINDSATRISLIGSSDIVINMLTRPYQFQVALDCLNAGISMISASYEDPKVKTLHRDAVQKNIIILNEMGLDPGIDHMLAMSLLSDLKAKGAVIKSFRSYGSGLPEAKIDTNPFDYAITWNPRNVLLAGEDGAIYKEDGKIKILPFHRIFDRTWGVPVKGLGYFEAYPNRDSLSYGSLLGINDSHTVIRGTLRYPGWSEAWKQIIQLGMTNELILIPELPEMTYRQFTAMFLPASTNDANVEQEAANYLGISPTGNIMSKLIWLGLFSREKIGGTAVTAAQAMTQLILKKFVLPDGMTDMVILQIEVEAVYPEENYRKEKISRLMIDYGNRSSYTAISRTVGMPVAVAADLLLQKKIQLIGVQIPTHPAIYERVLPALVENGIKYTDENYEV